MAAEVQDSRASSAPVKPKAKGPTPLFTKSGKPRQRYLRELVASLPAQSSHVARRTRKPTGNGARRLGIGRARLRALVREEARNEERVFIPKTLPRPIWRNVAYAFRRFNPEGLAVNQQAGQREAA